MNRQANTLSSESDAIFRAQRQQVTDFCHLYRGGRWGKWGVEARRARWRQLQLPKEGKWGGLRENHRFANENPRPESLQKLLQPSSAYQGSQEYQKNAETAIDNIKPMVKPYGLVFKKLLGWGGLGVASLFEVRDKNNHVPRQVVVKADLLHAPGYVEKEKEFYSYLLRASHVVQLVRLRLEASRLSGSKRKVEESDNNTTNKSSPPGKRRLLSAGTTPEKTRWRSAGAVGNTEVPAEVGVRAPNSAPPRGSRRILQPLPRIKGGTLEPSKKPSGSSEPTPGPPGPPAEVGGIENVLVLELLSRGDLLKWMGKMGSANKKFSNKVLWRFFECLFKGVVAMAHPPRNYDDFEATGGEDGPVEEERIPNELNDLGRNLIHFDLDPGNILVGDFNVGDKHGMTPILKIADFGLSRMIGDIKDDREMMWKSRKLGKYNNGNLAPEQFTKEWDWVNETPGTEREKPRIAGNYSWKTNLFHVGMIMWSLITLTHPPDAPYPTQFDSGRRDENGHTVWKWSYAGYMLDSQFNHLDARLRMLVIDLMMDDPADRPGLEDVARTIREAIDGEWPDESDANTREWAREFFEKPGVAGPVEPDADAAKFEGLMNALQGAAFG